MGAEAEGFSQFVMARERALQRTAVLLTGDWALAEDLVQTALAKTWPRSFGHSDPDPDRHQHRPATDQNRLLP